MVRAEGYSTVRPAESVPAPTLPKEAANHLKHVDLACTNDGHLSSKGFHETFSGERWAGEGPARTIEMVGLDEGARLATPPYIAQMHKVAA